VCWLFLGFHFPPLKIFDQEGTSSSFAETELFMTFFDVTTFYFEHYFFHYLVSYKLFPSSEKQTFMRSKIVSLQDAIPSFPHCEQFIKADWFFYSSILTELSSSLVLFVCVFFYTKPFLKQNERLSYHDMTEGLENAILRICRLVDKFHMDPCALRNNRLGRKPTREGNELPQSI